VDAGETTAAEAETATDPMAVAAAAAANIVRPR
jgi:hypothetical protein